MKKGRGESDALWVRKLAIQGLRATTLEPLRAAVQTGALYIYSQPTGPPSVYLIVDLAMLEGSNFTKWEFWQTALTNKAKTHKLFVFFVKI